MMSNMANKSKKFDAVLLTNEDSKVQRVHYTWSEGGDEKGDGVAL